MAEQVAVDLLINAAQSAKTVGEVKKALKELKNGMLEIGDEGSEDFKRLARAAAEVKDNLDDVNETIDTFNPDKMNALGAATRVAATGIQLATSAMALFGDQSQDVQKAMMKVQAAMSFAQAIGGLKELKKEFKTLFTFLQANPLLAVATALIAIAGAAYKVYKAFTETSDTTKALTNELEKQKKVTSELSGEYEREIEVLQAQGANQKDIIAFKRKLIETQLQEAEMAAMLHLSKIKDIEDNDSLYESYLRVASSIEGFLGFTEAQNQALAEIEKNKKERAEESQKAYDEEIEKIKNLRNQLVVLDFEEQKVDNEAYERNKALKEKQTQAEIALLDAIEKRRLDALKTQEEIEQREFELWQLQQEREKKKAADLAAYLEYKKQKEQEAHDLIKAQTKAEYELKKKVRQADLQVASDTLGALASISEDNAEAQKAFAAGQTLVDTYLAAQKAYTSQLIPGDPTSPIRGAIAAAAAIISGIARFRKIMQTDMKKPSGGGASASGASSGIGALNTTPQGVQPTTSLDPNGNVATPRASDPVPMTAVMVETQATRVQTRVQMFENLSRF